MLLKTPQHTITNLLHARELAVHTPTWRKYHPRNHNTRYNPYTLCKQAWQANHHEGYFYDMIHLLRHVAGGDLNAWWQYGRSRPETVTIFTDALSLIGHHDIPKRSRKRLSADEALTIRAELEAGLPVGDVAERFGVSANAVYAIRRGVTHKVAA